MKINANKYWVNYYADKANIDEIDLNKVGKWMYFFNNNAFATEICKKAIAANIVDSCKHTNNAETGVACFYLNIDDKEGHQRVIRFLLDNNLIKKTKAGKLTNLSFKLDSQTRSGEYGDKFKGKLVLADFIDLTTGKNI